MAKYRKIDTRIWNDEKFREASLSCQHLFLFILTHPSLTPLGAMRASAVGLMDELDWEAKGFPEAFQEAFAEGLAKAFWKHDRKARILWVPKFLKYNAPESPNVIKAWAKCLDDIPESPLKIEAIQSAKDYAEGLTEGYAKAFREAFAEALPKASLNQEQEQEQEQEQDKSFTPSDEGVVASQAADAPPAKRSAKTSKTATPSCPHQEILDLYHAELPMLPPIRIWNDQRQGLLRARWRENPKHQSLEFWRRLFVYVRERCPFLIGQVNPTGDRKAFNADLEWIIRPTNFAKIIEGRYEDKSREAAHG